MAFQKAIFIQYSLCGLAFLGLATWNVSLQRQITGKQESSDVVRSDHVRHKRSAEDQMTSSLRQPEVTQGGAVYIRWGRDECSDNDTELVYSGIAGASNFDYTGGAADMLCLSRDPESALFTNSLEDGGARIYGVEYEIGVNVLDYRNTASDSLQDSDVICAVCRSKTKTSQIMIPGRKTCTKGWKLEYWGYLMSGHHEHNSQLNFACVDEAPKGDIKGKRDDIGGALYNVQAVCGSLPCPNYVQGREVTCVVCTK